MIPSHVKEAIEHMIDDCAQTDYEDFQQIDIGCVEQWLKAESDPITPDALKAQRWQAGQTVVLGKRQGQPVLWLRGFLPNRPHYKLCWHTGEHHNGARLELWPGSGPIIALPGVRTMQQLAALVEMLGVQQ